MLQELIHCPTATNKPLHSGLDFGIWFWAVTYSKSRCIIVCVVINGLNIYSTRITVLVFYQVLVTHGYVHRKRIWLFQNLLTHSHFYLLLVTTQILLLTRRRTSYSHWICSWTTRAKWSISRIWESLPKLSFRLIWGESYKTWVKQSFICLVVDNPHILCAVLKIIHQHFYTAPIWSTVKH